MILGAFFPIEVHVPPQIADVLTKQGQPIPPPATGLAISLMDFLRYAVFCASILGLTLTVNACTKFDLDIPPWQRQNSDCLLERVVMHALVRKVMLTIIEPVATD